MAACDAPALLTFSDSDLREAIEELGRSTETISKQTETLRLQHDALDRLVKQTKKDGDARAELEARQVEAWGTSRRVLVEHVGQHQLPHTRKRIFSTWLSG